MGVSDGRVAQGLEAYRSNVDGRRAADRRLGASTACAGAVHWLTRAAMESSLGVSMLRRLLLAESQGVSLAPPVWLWAVRPRDRRWPVWTLRASPSMNSRATPGTAGAQRVAIRRTLARKPH